MLLEIRVAVPFYKNGFVLGCEETREGVIIDPGDEVDELLEAVKTERLSIRHILLTHGHVDHVSGVGAAKAALAAQVSLHHDDLFLYQMAVEQGATFGLEIDPLPPVDRFYAQGDTIRFGRYEVKVHHTPGHSPGGVSLQVGRAGEFGQRIFVGDTLFAGSIGRSDLPGGDYDTLIRSIRNVLFGLGDDAEVFPGHGASTTIAQERRTNPFLT
jgi:hydroxyacylglutathione hydrolase